MRIVKHFERTFFTFYICKVPVYYMAVFTAHVHINRLCLDSYICTTTASARLLIQLVRTVHRKSCEIRG